MNNASLPTAPLLRGLSLRAYQREGINVSRDYIAAYRRGATNEAALVHMATGTGKTGLIAALARCTPEIATVLVLAPRVALRQQLELDIKSRFFSRLERHPQQIPKTVVDLSQLISAESTPNLKNLVLVSTFQMLESMSRTHPNPSARHKKKAAIFQQIIRDIDLVLIDEGHYEPALSWSRALRRIKAPRILFTATPYRNDLKAFDVNLEYAYHYSLGDATRDNVIRHVEVKKRPETNDPQQFVTDVLEFYDRSVAPIWPEARVIIRCDNVGSIAQMVAVMRAKKRSYLAIHDRFKDKPTNPCERRTVPVRAAEDSNLWYGPSGPKFWIHQFKLLEGIDDDRFRMVAIFEPLSNARQIVQQVGRIIRNAEQPNPAVAYLLDHSGGYHEREWNELFKYDDDLKARNASDASLQANFVQDSLAAHPERTYIDGSVRSRFDFSSFEPHSDLRLTRTANLLRKQPTRTDFQRLIADVSRHLAELDRVFKQYNLKSDGAVIFVYVAVEAVPFLKSSYFLAGRPGVIVIREMQQLIAFHDSEGASPFGFPGLERAERPDQLRKLFSDNPLSKLVTIATKNAQLGHRAVRARSLSAASINETVPALDDNTQVLTRAGGYSQEDETADGEGASRPLRRRYIGFRNGRIMETSERVDLATYFSWLTEVEQIVLGTRRRLSTFGRYAQEIRSVPNPDPRNILLDFFEVAELFQTITDHPLSGKAGQKLELDNLCRDVSRTVTGDSRKRFTFNVRANNDDHEVEIVWHSDKARYQLISPSLDAKYRGNGQYKTITEYLNREQSFRVLPETNDVIYADGSFYEIVLPIGSKFDKKRYHIGQILEGINVLRTVIDEKGHRSTPQGADWSHESLFGLISREGRGAPRLESEFRSMDVIVCDDMATESADFILASESRVVFVHVKGAGRGAPSLYSASKLSVVCAQAIKNIRYLSMFNTQKPKHVLRWDTAWSSPKTTQGSVTDRIRKAPRGKASAVALWEELNKRIANPRTYREVWLFLGGVLSKSRLETELSKNKPAAEAVQAVTLLHGTLASIGSIDAKLRVFCSP